MAGSSARVDRHPRGLHQAGARLQARHHLHRGAEAASHSAILLGQEGAVREVRKHSGRNDR